MAQAQRESAQTNQHDLFAGGGAMGERMRAFDWGGTSLGPPERWPQSLRTTVGTCLASRFPILIWWGPEQVMLYNDAYTSILGDKHPRALGQPGRVVWPEIWSIIGPMLGAVLERGEASWSNDQLLLLERYGFAEECYFTFSYSPVRDESGAVAGVFTVVTETTERVVGTRRLHTLSNLAARTGAALTPQAVAASAGTSLAENPNDLPFTLLYLLDRAGAATLAQATGVAGLPALPGAPFALDTASLLARAAARREVVTIDDMGELAALLPGARLPDARAALALPVSRSLQEQPYGLLVVGLSQHRTLDDDYRSFCEMLAGQLAMVLANAHAYAEERQRAELLAELDQAKTLFFNNISHEFRTPLTLILGPLEDILTNPSFTLLPHQREPLTLIYRNALRLLKLVNTLLEFSQIEAGRADATYAALDLAALTTDLASVFRAAIERAGLQLEIDIAPLPEPIYVDRQMYEKIVFNLLSNALKFTFEGAIGVRLSYAGDHVALEVTDTGVGIPEDELPHVFDRFHRVAGTSGRTHEGSGIGLALVHELVKLHGGQVAVESSPGQGSAFTVALPTGSAHLPAERISASASDTIALSNAAQFVTEALTWLPDPGVSAELGAQPDPTGLGEGARLPRTDYRTPLARVLIVEDNADMRAYLRRLLHTYYAVAAAHDGQAALERVRSWSPDLVLTDVMLPKLDGFELLRELRDSPLTRTLPVILLSARAGEEATAEGLANGADDYLVKPFSPLELLARVDTALRLAQLRSRAFEQERERERAQALQMRQMAEASLALTGERSRMQLVQEITARARSIIGAHVAITTLVMDENWPEAINAVVRSDSYAAEYEPRAPSGDGLPARICRENHPLRLSSAQLAASPEWRAPGVPGGWLAAPLIAPGGKNMGLIQLFDKQAGEFNPADEAMLVQLAQLAVVALENDRLYREAQAALQLRDAFFSIAAHELKTPLTSLLGHAELLQRRNRRTGDLESRNRRSVDTIVNQARRLNLMIQTLLDISRLEQGRLSIERRPVDLSALTRQVVDEMQPMLDQHSLKYEPSAEPLLMLGDALRLEQVLHNIVSNAVKYTPQGGVIEIATERQGGDVCMIVRDHGIGVPAAALPRLFDQYFRAENASRQFVSGLGLGLYVVKQIVSMHGGSVAVESHEGQGSTFTVCLPAA